MEATTAVAGMFDSITSTTLQAVLTQVTDLIPVVAPAVIGFIGFRKAWSFIQNAIQGA